MRRTVLAAAVGFGLAACQPQAPDGAPATPPADAPVTADDARLQPEPTPFDPPLSAHGTEPFWALELTEQSLTLTRPDQPPLSMANPGMRMQGDKATWDALSAGARIYVEAETRPCSDGMSDRAYPLTIQVRTGEVSLHGCAAKAAEAPPGSG